jgi:hypothetical protein
MSSSFSQKVDYAGVAQQVEQLICNQQVAGSIPSTSSKTKSPQQSLWAFCA